MDGAAEAIRGGDLGAARRILADRVRTSPGDAARRFELAEVQIVQGDWERADGHLAVISTQDPTWATVTALLRQLIRAAVEREEVFTAGRAPAFAVDPTPAVAGALRALVAGRSGEAAAAPDAEAEEEVAAVAGRIDGRAFTGLRDLDDRTAGVLELLTSTGRYMWAPWSAVRSLTLRPVERLRDLVWRSAELDLEGGPNGVVYLPAIYPAPAAEMTDALRLGRETRWVDEGERVRGLGQRCLLLGEEVTALGDLGELALGPEDATAC